MTSASPQPQDHGDNMTDDIEWHGPAEVWTFPLPDDKVQSLKTYPASTDGMVEIMAIGPEEPDLIMHLGYETQNVNDYCEDGGPMFVRFGRMKIGDLLALPEHEGW